MKIINKINDKNRRLSRGFAIFLGNFWALKKLINLRRKEKRKMERKENWRKENHQM
jgi:hypothetical protein